MARNLRWRSIFFAGAVTAMAGFVDGVGFIHFGGYFLSFMSGNSTRASAALLDGDPGDWVMAMGLVASFVAGVAAVTMAASRVSTYRRPLALFSSALLLSIAALLGTLEELGAGRLGMLGASLLAAAMGAVNVSYTRGGEVSLGLTYMTGTLVKFGQHLGNSVISLFSGPRSAESLLSWAPYATLWLMITTGSLAGVFCYLQFGLHCLWLVVSGMLTWALLALLRVRRLPADGEPTGRRREIT